MGWRGGGCCRYGGSAMDGEVGFARKNLNGKSLFGGGIERRRCGHGDSGGAMGGAPDPMVGLLFFCFHADDQRVVVGYGEHGGHR